ncbi:hypothetical protein V6S67_07125 [Arthrobacter sp. Soc17.1.1.1]|uniref:hypothetical protein n=1 Tax=Arthrobacter sp. Soc17.1.1.1 TaxID=3121277 RepID=UPI002FE48C31
MDDRIEEFVMREELIMLTAAELDLENTQPTDFPEPRRVYAWIRYPSKAIRIQAHAVAYTRTAVKIRFLEPLIQIQREGWVWLNSVLPVPNSTNYSSHSNHDDKQTGNRDKKKNNRTGE